MTSKTLIPSKELSQEHKLLRQGHLGERFSSHAWQVMLHGTWQEFCLTCSTWFKNMFFIQSLLESINNSGPFTKNTQWRWEGFVMLCILLMKSIKILHIKAYTIFVQRAHVNTHWYKTEWIFFVFYPWIKTSLWKLNYGHYRHYNL